MSSLAAAVILQAMADAGLEGRSTIPEPIRQEAIAFLTATEGQWKRARENWCHACDCCPDALRERVLDRLPSVPPKKPRKPRAGTKTAIVRERLASPEGFDVTAVAKEFGWKRNSLYSVIGDLRRQGVPATRCADGRYRLVP